MKTQNKENNIEMPSLLTVSPSPHLKAPITTSNLMLDVIIALTPALVWGIYMAGYRAILILFISLLSCILFETVSCKLMGRKTTLRDLSAAVTGIILAMNLPVTVPLWMPIVGAFFAIVVAKQLFGGIGKNIVNPALAARVFLISWAGDMTRYASPSAPVNSLAVKLSEADVVSSATPLVALKNGTLPEATLGDTFVGNIGGSIGEVSALFLIIGGLYLIVRRVISWHIPVTYIATVALLTYFFPQTNDAFRFMLYELTTGGLMLGAFFMATDYVTSPITDKGKIIFGIGCGGLTVLIRYFGGYPEGVSFAILIMNLLVWYIDLIGAPKRFGSVKVKKEKAPKKNKTEA